MEDLIRKELLKEAEKCHDHVHDVAVNKIILLDAVNHIENITKESMSMLGQKNLAQSWNTTWDKLDADEHPRIYGKDNIPGIADEIEEKFKNLFWEYSKKRHQVKVGPTSVDIGDGGTRPENAPSKLGEGSIYYRFEYRRGIMPNEEESMGKAQNALESLDKHFADVTISPELTFSNFKNYIDQLDIGLRPYYETGHRSAANGGLSVRELDQFIRDENRNDGSAYRQHVSQSSLAPIRSTGQSFSQMLLSTDELNSKIKTDLGIMKAIAKKFTAGYTLAEGSLYEGLQEERINFWKAQGIDVHNPPQERAKEVYNDIARHLTIRYEKIFKSYNKGCTAGAITEEQRQQFGAEGKPQSHYRGDTGLGEGPGLPSFQEKKKGRVKCPDLEIDDLRLLLKYMTQARVANPKVRANEFMVDGKTLHQSNGWDSYPGSKNNSDLDNLNVLTLPSIRKNKEGNIHYDTTGINLGDQHQEKNPDQVRALLMKWGQQCEAWISKINTMQDISADSRVAFDAMQNIFQNRTNADTHNDGDTSLYPVAKMMDFVYGVMTRSCEEIVIDPMTGRQEKFYGRNYSGSTGVGGGGQIMLSVKYAFRVEPFNSGGSRMLTQDEELRGQIPREQGKRHIAPRQEGFQAITQHPGQTENMPEGYLPEQFESSQYKIKEQISYFIGQAGSTKGFVKDVKSTNPTDSDEGLSWLAATNIFQERWPDAMKEFSFVFSRDAVNMQRVEKAVKNALNAAIKNVPGTKAEYTDQDGNSTNLKSDASSQETPVTSPVSTDPATPASIPPATPEPAPDEITNVDVTDPAVDVTDPAKSLDAPGQTSYIQKRNNPKRTLVRDRRGKLGSIEERLIKAANKLDKCGFIRLAEKIDLLLETIVKAQNDRKKS